MMISCAKFYYNPYIQSEERSRHVE